MSRYYEISGCIHIHFPLNWGGKGVELMGLKGIEANADFLILTSHTPQKHPERFKEILEAENYYGKTLVISGEEVHDETKESHALVIDHSKWTGLEKSFSDTFHEIAREKTLSFIAHPDGYHNLFLVGNDHRWKRWEIEDVAGIEVWSLLFDWIASTHIVNLPLRYMNFPSNLKGPGSYNLSLWDNLSQRKKTVGIAGLDIHAIPFPFLDVKKTFRYENVFKILRNHLLLKKPLSGNFIEDKTLILECLKKGNLFFANDLLRESKHFYFGDANGDFFMGDKIEPGKEVVVEIPVKTKTRLLKNGKIIWEGEIENKKFILEKEGHYRIEVFLADKHWIFSNHICVKGKRMLKFYS